jgi:peptide-methionine (R)-S-oxide reductase
MDSNMPKTDEEWKKKLSKEQYHVLREKGTERAFTGTLLNNHEKGMYVCAGCGAELFDSDTKYDSGSGWPSFYQPANQQIVGEKDDKSLFMKRTEVYCKKCGGHLGHVFEDGPQPTGLRYCVNSLSLGFKKGDKTEEKK